MVLRRADRTTASSLPHARSDRQLAHADWRGLPGWSRRGAGACVHSTHRTSQACVKRIAVLAGTVLRMIGKLRIRQEAGHGNRRKSRQLGLPDPLFRGGLSQPRGGGTGGEEQARRLRHPGPAQSAEPAQGRYGAPVQVGTALRTVLAPGRAARGRLPARGGVSGADHQSLCAQGGNSRDRLRDPAQQRQQAAHRRAVAGVLPPQDRRGHPPGWTQARDQTGQAAELHRALQGRRTQPAGRGGNRSPATAVQRRGADRQGEAGGRADRCALDPGRRDRVHHRAPVLPPGVRLRIQLEQQAGGDRDRRAHRRGDRERRVVPREGRHHDVARDDVRTGRGGRFGGDSRKRLCGEAAEQGDGGKARRA